MNQSKRESEPIIKRMDIMQKSKLWYDIEAKRYTAMTKQVNYRKRSMCGDEAITSRYHLQENMDNLWYNSSTRICE